VTAREKSIDCGGAPILLDGRLKLLALGRRCPGRAVLESRSAWGGQRLVDADQEPDINGLRRVLGMLRLHTSPMDERR